MLEKPSNGALVRVLLASSLRSRAGGEAVITVQVGTVWHAIDQIVERHPALGEVLRDESGAVPSFLHLFHNDEELADGDQTQLAPGDTLTIVPAIAGG